MVPDLILNVNLYADGDRLFDLLKAAVRHWQGAQWEHERERARFALELYERGLDSYRSFLEEARQKAESGFNTEADKKLLREGEDKLKYWEKKLEEVRIGS